MWPNRNDTAREIQPNGSLGYVWKQVGTPVVRLFKSPSKLPRVHKNFVVIDIAMNLTIERVSPAGSPEAISASTGPDLRER